MLSEEVQKVRQSFPVNYEFNPPGYRKVVGWGQASGQRRDMQVISQMAMFEMAYTLYDRSGLVKRFVQDTRNFVLGEGVTFSVEGDDSREAAEWLQKFWDHPMNRMPLRLKKRVEFFGLLGEQCWPVVVNPINGEVWMSYVDPQNIVDVETLMDFPEIPSSVRLFGRDGGHGKRMPVVRMSPDIRKPEFGRLVGECFFFSVNNPPNDPRGRSDLVAIFDFLDTFEEGLFDELDRLKLVKSYIWDVLVKGADEQKIQEFMEKTETPQPGSMRVHNENVEWNAVAPDLKTADNKAFFDMMKTYLSACTNRPDSWLGSGGKAYQTEADLMGEPTYKALNDRQDIIRFAIHDVLTFVLDQAILHGSVKDGNYKISVDMPEISAKDTNKLATALTQITSALMLGEQQGYIAKQDAARIYCGVASQLGAEVEPPEIDDDPNMTEDYRNDATRERISDDAGIPDGEHRDDDAEEV